MGCRGYYDEIVTLEENLLVLMSLGKYAFRLQEMEYYINYSDEDSSGEDDVKVNSATYNTPRKVPLDDIKRKKYNRVR